MEAHAKTTVRWKAGLHIRPATYIVKLLQKYPCEIKIIKDNSICNAKSVIQIISLGAECGANLTIEAKGEESDRAVEALKTFFDEYEDVEDMLW
ncbi:MAG: HPr family phosphocarrier protein [Candidatus Brocadiae bacterium]|nr:HPr family phosphocarrier protein [Candidatus Brocadiia bacterium]